MSTTTADANNGAEEDVWVVTKGVWRGETYYRYKKSTEPLLENDQNILSSDISSLNANVDEFVPRTRTLKGERGDTDTEFSEHADAAVQEARYDSDDDTVVMYTNLRVESIDIDVQEVSKVAAGGTGDMCKDLGAKPKDEDAQQECRGTEGDTAAMDKDLLAEPTFGDVKEVRQDAGSHTVALNTNMAEGQKDVHVQDVVKATEGDIVVIGMDLDIEQTDGDLQIVRKDDGRKTVGKNSNISQPKDEDAQEVREDTGGDTGAMNADQGVEPKGDAVQTVVKDTLGGTIVMDMDKGVEPKGEGELETREKLETSVKKASVVVDKENEKEEDEGKKTNDIVEKNHKPCIIFFCCIFNCSRN